MADVDTAKAIKANIETILTGLGYKVRSKEEPTAQVHKGSKEPDRNFGEGPLYLAQDFELIIKKTVKDPADASDEEDTIHFAIIGAFKSGSDLNIGALELSKLVSAIDHDIDGDYENQILTIHDTMTVWYRLND